MRASKESCVRAKQDVALLGKAVELLVDDPSRVNSRKWKQLQTALACLGEFLNAAHRRLPTEAAIERDRKRKRA